ncbi:MAG: hypothetical protein WCQ48_08900 [Chloroflexota bacterium]
MRRPRRNRPIDFDKLHQEPCLLMEDLEAIRKREPELWEEFAVSTEQCLTRADKGMPFVISTSHVVEYRGRMIRICGLVLLREQRFLENVMYSSIAMTEELYEELVKTFGLRRTIRRKAILHLADGDLYSAAEAFEEQEAVELEHDDIDFDADDEEDGEDDTDVDDDADDEGDEGDEGDQDSDTEDTDDTDADDGTDVGDD